MPPGGQQTPRSPEDYPSQGHLDTEPSQWSPGGWTHALCISLETEDLTVTWQLNHPPITCRETRNSKFDR
ncbi:hypothetical protein D623_10018566 [Myotis brandtii]|uniref:Uncharacterized protein n=1 Tax=Myotis brandtii TaxID=109478 RepID=S7PVA8_MYOBR|nr:hypothetical protein D623_10018566 [Myotis brandtii]